MSSENSSIQVKFSLNSERAWRLIPLNGAMKDMDICYNSANKAILGSNSAYEVVTYISDISHDFTWCNMVDSGPKTWKTMFM